MNALRTANLAHAIARGQTGSSAVNHVLLSALLVGTVAATSLTEGAQEAARAVGCHLQQLSGGGEACGVEHASAQESDHASWMVEHDELPTDVASRSNPATLAELYAAGALDGDSFDRSRETVVASNDPAFVAIGAEPPSGVPDFMAEALAGEPDLQSPSELSDRLKPFVGQEFPLARYGTHSDDDSLKGARDAAKWMGGHLDAMLESVRRRPPSQQGTLLDMLEDLRGDITDFLEGNFLRGLGYQPDYEARDWGVFDANDPRFLPLQAGVPPQWVESWIGRTGSLKTLAEYRKRGIPALRPSDPFFEFARRSLPPATALRLFEKLPPKLRLELLEDRSLLKQSSRALEGGIDEDDVARIVQETLSDKSSDGPGWLEAVAYVASEISGHPEMIDPIGELVEQGVRPRDAGNSGRRVRTDTGRCPAGRGTGPGRTPCEARRASAPRGAQRSRDRRPHRIPRGYATT